MSMQVYGKRGHGEEDLPPAKRPRTDDPTGNLNGRQVISWEDIPIDVITRMISFLPQKAATAYSLTSKNNYVQTIVSVSDLFRNQILSNLEVIGKSADWVGKSKRFIQLVKSVNEGPPSETLSMVYKKFPKDQMGCLVNLSQIIDLSAWKKLECPLSNLGTDWFHMFRLINELKILRAHYDEYIHPDMLDDEFDEEGLSKALISASKHLDKENFFQLVEWFIDNSNAIYRYIEAIRSKYPGHSLGLEMANGFGFIFKHLFEDLLETNKLTLISKIFDKFGNKIISMNLFNPYSEGVPLCIAEIISDYDTTLANKQFNEISQFIRQNKQKLSPLTQDLFKAALISRIISEISGPLNFQKLILSLINFSFLYKTLSSPLIKDRCMHDFVISFAEKLPKINLDLDKDPIADKKNTQLLKICVKLARVIESLEIKVSALKCLCSKLGKYYKDILMSLVPISCDLEIDGLLTFITGEPHTEDTNYADVDYCLTRFIKGKPRADKDTDKPN